MVTNIYLKVSKILPIFFKLALRSEEPKKSNFTKIRDSRELSCVIFDDIAKKFAHDFYEAKHRHSLDQPDKHNLIS